MGDQKEEQDIKEFIKSRYGKIAQKTECGCCSDSSTMSLDQVIEQAKRIGYTEDELKNIPDSAILGLGCGNPTAIGGLKQGEVVLDLGAGAGIDVFMAANKVGSEGHVIGVDMTPQMIEKGRENAEKYGYKNVEFRLGEIENLPIEDGTVDVIISNCVINLAPDKTKVFLEAFRVLRPGGRLMISDLVTEGELPDDVRKSFQAWSECIAGALEKNEYLGIIQASGFDKINIVNEKVYIEDKMDERLKDKIISLNVSATKLD